MKMANMDSAFDFMFTSPKDDKGVSFILNLVFDTSIIGAEVDGRGGGGSAVTVYSGSKPKLEEGCQILSTRLQSYPFAFHWKTGSLVVKSPTK